MKYLFTIILIVFLLAHSANAQTLSFYDFNIGQPLSQAVFDFDKGYDFSLASGDLGGDGKAEIILAAGKGQEPWIRILRADGSLITQLLAYDKSFTGGVSLCVQDLNNDGKAEIVVGAGEGGGPHVRILNGLGEAVINPGFFAFDKSQTCGISVGAVDIDGDKNKEILVASNFGSEPKLKIFNLKAKMLKEFKLEDLQSIYGYNIGSVDLGGDGIEEILISGQYNSLPKVIIYRGDGSIVRTIDAYKENFRGGVQAVGFDHNNDGRGEILTGSGVTGGPHVKVFDGFGNVLKEFFANLVPSDAGLNIAIADFGGAGQKELLVTPKAEKQSGIDAARHYIDVDVNKQTFSLYDSGYLIETFKTSTGKPSTPTRLGNFKVLSKYTFAVGGDGQQTWGMPYFVGFYMSGILENGVHALPFINGVKEGLRSLGIAVSHGCVRLADFPALKFFNWVKVGDAISVHR